MVRPLTSLSAVVLMVAAAHAGAVTLAVGEPFPREPETPRSLSGITCADGGGFLAVADDARHGEVGLYRCSIRLSDDGMTILSSAVSTNDVVRLAGAVDLEAVAFDPLTGHVWAVDESKRTISAYDVTSGQLVSSLAYPDVLRRNRGNLGFESLAISPDGLTLWTCNEEALDVDGARSSARSGTTVRLVKFVRPDAQTPWKPAGMYPYRTEKWRHPQAFGSLCRRGVADLTALPDGSLLVLERDLSFTAAFAGQLSFSVFRVARPEVATDVSAIASLADGGWTAVEKTELASGEDALVAYGNFEGMCLGPKLADGRRSLVLVSDAGDGFSRSLFLSLVLSGIE